jgi:glyoxylase-like metal-dependent hydrolase (beta-lactamase superfamily II)
MSIQEIAPRLWWWTAPHPDWAPEDLEGGEGWEETVSSYALLVDDGFLLFDPLVRDWDWLDDEVARHGPPVVLITIFWHARSSQEILDRYEGASLWAHEPAVEWIGERTRYTNTFNVGDDLPGAVEAIEMHRGREVAYRLPTHDAVVVGDALLRHGDRAALFPPTWVRDDQVLAAAIDAVHRLLERRPGRLLLTHGGPTDSAAVDTAPPA